MAKKYLLHRITEEDAQYIAEDTYTNRNEISGGNCYLLVNKNSDKVYRENGHILIYKASGIQVNTHMDPEKKRFLEAIEACSYFRGYANRHRLNFKTSKISELLYELEDHSIEIPDECDSSVIVTTSGNTYNQEVLDYIAEASNGYEVLNSLQRNLPTLALFINESIPARANEQEEIDEQEEEEDEELPFL